MAEDADAAFRHYQIASDLGNPVAMNNLACTRFVCVELLFDVHSKKKTLAKTATKRATACRTT